MHDMVALHDDRHVYMQWILAGMHEALKVAIIFRTIIFPLAPLTFQAYTYSGDKNILIVTITDPDTSVSVLICCLEVH